MSIGLGLGMELGLAKGWWLPWRVVPDIVPIYIYISLDTVRARIVVPIWNGYYTIVLAIVG